MTKKKQIDLSICLIKEDNSTLLDSQLIDTSKCHAPIAIAIGDATTNLYIKKQYNSQPEWVQFLDKAPEVKPEKFGVSLSTGALLIIRIAELTFVISFGQGHFLKEEDTIVKGFGLKTALNSIEPKDIRSLDKATGEITPLNARTQSNKGVEIFDLLIDTEIDFLQSLSAQVRDEYVELLGSKMSGRDILKISPRIDIYDLVPILIACFNQYQKPLPQEFSWVNNVRRVTDKPLIYKLKAKLADLLDNNLNGDVWIGEPEIVDHELIKGYSFTEKSEQIDLFLRLDHLVNILRNKNKDKTITPKQLDNQYIFARMSDGRLVHKWSAYRCLNAELQLGKGDYLLKNGEWYKVAKNFKNKIDDELKPIPVNKVKLPNYSHTSEANYNDEVAQVHGYHCLDAKNIYHGGGRSQIEFCDLFHKGSDTKLIHVKRYSGSATLSHLFAQGAISGELFRSDLEFRKKLNKRLPKKIQFQDVQTPPITSNYHIIFGIVTKKDLPFELPFFSKITLKNTYKSLTALGYQVSISKIEINKNIELTTVGLTT